MQETDSTSRNKDSGPPPPRARCIIEFIEGDVNRPPIVYPVGGSEEIDTAMCEASLDRWGARK
jgi:hypothetical protein